jgi:Sec-independent protein translocase protein TatA
MSADSSSQDAAERAAKKAREAGEKIRDGLDRLKDRVADVKDSVNEKLHREAAQAEHARRDAAGEDMTAGDRVASVANEAKSTVQAGIDALKQRVRKP